MPLCATVYKKITYQLYQNVMNKLFGSQISTVKYKSSNSRRANPE